MTTEQHITKPLDGLANVVSLTSRSLPRSNEGGARSAARLGGEDAASKPDELRSLVDALLAAAGDPINAVMALHLSRAAYRNALKKAAREAGLDEERAKHFSRYDFRHNRANHLLDATGDIRGVGHLLGHTLPTTTDKYLGPSLNGAKRAIA